MFGNPPPQRAVPRPTRNQIHALNHPGERLSGSSYGLLWGLAALAGCVTFPGFVLEDASSGTIIADVGAVARRDGFVVLTEEMGGKPSAPAHFQWR